MLVEEVSEAVDLETFLKFWAIESLIGFGTDTPAIRIIFLFTMM
ncbi:MAG: hypothetical protein M2R45_00592 [Verrucomicrobia subdivision 3 bacterium]|nr:hypothetical protein [Limisphaerales bacterium]MCS1417807.1 hypothetical protein [Limisphaerales bacterium]